MVILFIALFITSTYAESFRSINDNFNPYFWESNSWMGDNALDLPFPVEILRPNYAQSLKSSKLDEVYVITDLSLLNHFPQVKQDVNNAQIELTKGKNTLAPFKEGICLDVFSQASSAISDCIRRGGSITTRGCRVREENETNYYGYRIEALCVMDYVHASSNYKNTLTYYTNTLEYSVKATNSLYSQINNEFILLEDLGAGYENYYGGAKQTYLETKQIYDVMSFQEVTGVTPNTNSISYQYSTAYNEALQIREEFLETPSGPNFQFLKTMPNTINSLAGRENSLILKGVVLHQELILAQQTIINEFELLRDLTEDNKQTAETALTQLRNQKVELITAVPAEYMISEIETPENIDSDIYLDWELQNIYPNLIIFNDEAKELYEDVKNYTTNGNDNLGQAIEKLTIANHNYEISKTLSDNLLSEFDGLASWMETNARQKQTECNAKLQNTTQSSRAFALIYKQEAQELLDSSPQTIGERYVTYLNAFTNSKECVDICEGKETFLLFDSKLSEFNKIIQAAEKDGLDVSEYKIWYNFYTSYEYSYEDFTLIESDIDGFISEIYSLAYSEYEEEIISKRLQIKGQIYSMYSYDSSLSAKKTLFEKWENYYTGGSINYKKALGHLKEILKDYDSILSSLESKIPDVLKNKFENEYIIQENWKKTPVLDEPVNLDIIVKINNPTDLFYDSTMTIEIPFKYEVYTLDVVSKSKDINRIAKTGNNLLIEFSQINPRESYEIKFNLNTKMFRKFSYSETTVENTNEYQKIRRVITFDSDIDVDLLYSFEDIPSDVVSCNTEINGIQKETNNLGQKAKIELTDIKKGRNIYHFYYTLENRSLTQNMSQGSYQEEYTDILDEIGKLNETATLLEDNGLINESQNLIFELEALNELLDDSQKDYNLGKYADAFDKLKEIRNITEGFDLFSSLESIRESLGNEFNSLNAVWIRSGDEDEETKGLMSQIEENLIKLRSLTLSKEDIPLLGQTQNLLDSLSSKIGSSGKSTLTELSSEIIIAKDISNSFENTIYPKYRVYYNALRTYKVEDNVILSFPYKLTDLDSKLKTIKKSISDIENRIDNEPNILLSDFAYISSFRETVVEFNITNTGVENTVNNVENKTNEYIDKTEQAVEILKNRELSADASSKLSSISEELTKAKQFLEKQEIIDAFKTSSKAYYDSLRILSGTNPKLGGPDEENPILLIGATSILLLFIIGGLFFYKGNKPEKEEVVYTSLKREE